MRSLPGFPIEPWSTQGWSQNDTILIHFEAQGSAAITKEEDLCQRDLPRVQWMYLSIGPEVWLKRIGPRKQSLTKSKVHFVSPENEDLNHFAEKIYHWFLVFRSKCQNSPNSLLRAGIILVRKPPLLPRRRASVCTSINEGSSRNSRHCSQVMEILPTTFFSWFRK